MKILTLVVFCLLFACTVAGATEAVERPKECQQCGMDRTMFAHSRMLISYADGTTVGVCSLNCAAENMKQHKGMQVVSLKVADYQTKELIDARSATWVMGGTKQGVMTALPKWAFAREEDARNFVKENGGEVTRFDQAMEAANKEFVEETETEQTHQGHTGHDMSSHMGPGAQMQFNPAFGEDIYHTHPAGMWMVNYKFMHMDMRGLQDGTKNVSVDQVIPMMGTKYGFMMTPTSMTMDMHMVMAMYGVTDRLTLMGMATYVANEMEMLMNMGMGKGNTIEPPMNTNGIGDTEVRAIYKITDYLVASLGLSIPTGDIKQEFGTMGRTYRAPYDMQLGSGTFDLKPALTYSDLSSDALWNWGAQVSYTNHIGKNDSGYSLGDTIKATTWLQRALGPAATWARLAFSNTGHINGRDPEIQILLNPNPMIGASTPDADPNNYGGQRLDALVGVSFAKGPFSFGVEGGLPVYQNLNGLQLATGWFLTTGFQAMF